MHVRKVGTMHAIRYKLMFNHYTILCEILHAAAAAVELDVIIFYRHTGRRAAFPDNRTGRVYALRTVLNVFDLNAHQ